MAKSKAITFTKSGQNDMEKIKRLALNVLNNMASCPRIQKCS